MKYFHFHDWTGEELAAAARIPPRQMEIRDSACVCGAHRGEGVTKEREKPDPVVERWDRERKRKTISLFFLPAVYISLSHFPCGSHRMGGRRVLGTRRVSIKWL